MPGKLYVEIEDTLFQAEIPSEAGREVRTRSSRSVSFEGTVALLMLS